MVGENATAELESIPINYKTQKFAKVIAEEAASQNVNAILDIIDGADFEQKMKDRAARCSKGLIPFTSNSWLMTGWLPVRVSV